MTEHDFEWGDDELPRLGSREKAFGNVGSSYNPETRTADGVIVTKDEDADNEVVLPRGMEPTIDRFKDNPIVLFNHGKGPHGSMPIGRVIPETISITDNAIEGTFQLREKGRSAIADQVADAIEDGMLSKLSAGFQIHEIKRSPNDGPLIITKATLVEWSVVPAPANGNARIKSTTLDRLVQSLALVNSATHASGGAVKTLYARPTDLEVIRRCGTIVKNMQEVFASENHIDQAQLEEVLRLRDELGGFSVLTQHDREKGVEPDADMESLEKALAACDELSATMSSLEEGGKGE